MASVTNVLDYLCEIAPISLKKSTDNVGFLVGCQNRTVSKILVSLDITDEVISEAIDIGANLIVSHHPVLFSLTSITDLDLIGSRVLKLIENGIAAMCMHTNLDATHGGVNDALAEVIGINSPTPFIEVGKATDEDLSYGRYGFIAKPRNICDFADDVKKALGANGLRYYDAGREVSKVGVSGGSGGIELEYALREDCDTFITADIKYSLFLEAKEVGINLIDAGHYPTENVIVPVLTDKLSTRFPEIEVILSKKHTQIINFL